MLTQSPRRSACGEPLRSCKWVISHSVSRNPSQDDPNIGRVPPKWRIIIGQLIPPRCFFSVINCFQNLNSRVSKNCLVKPSCFSLAPPEIPQIFGKGGGFAARGSALRGDLGDVFGLLVLLQGRAARLEGGLSSVSQPPCRQSSPIRSF